MRSLPFWAVTHSRLVTDVSVQPIGPSSRIKQSKKNHWRAKFSRPFFLIVCCRSEGLDTRRFTPGETDCSRRTQGTGDWMSPKTPPDTLEGEKSLIPPRNRTPALRSSARSQVATDTEISGLCRKGKSLLPDWINRADHYCGDIDSTWHTILLLGTRLHDFVINAS